MAQRKLLCIADATPECRSAVVFGAERARRTGANLLIMRVIEPLDKSLLGSIGEAIREEVRQEAMEDLDRFATIAKEIAGFAVETFVYEGEVIKAIQEQIEEDNEIKTLLLAASGSRNGPGPLVSAAMRGSVGFSSRAVAIMIVPDGLTDEQLIELAS